MKIREIRVEPTKVLTTDDTDILIKQVLLSIKAKLLAVGVAVRRDVLDQQDDIGGQAMRDTNLTGERAKQPVTKLLVVRGLRVTKVPIVSHRPNEAGVDSPDRNSPSATNEMARETREIRENLRRL